MGEPFVFALSPRSTRNAGFRNHNEAVYLLNTLSTAGVDLIIAGHLHQYNDYELAEIPVVTSEPNGHITPHIERYCIVEVFPEKRRLQTTRVW